MQFGDAFIPSTFEDDMIPSSPITQVCIPLLKKNSNRGMDDFQEHIRNSLHEHTFFNIISDMICNLHHVHLRSCCKPQVQGHGPFAYLTIP